MVDLDESIADFRCKALDGSAQDQRIDRWLNGQDDSGGLRQRACAALSRFGKAQVAGPCKKDFCLVWHQAKPDKHTSRARMDIAAGHLVVGPNELKPHLDLDVSKSGVFAS